MHGDEGGEKLAVLAAYPLTAAFVGVVILTFFYSHLLYLQPSLLLEIIEVNMARQMSAVVVWGH